MKKSYLVIVVLLMVIGFAATTITLQILGEINLVFDEDTFKAGIIFTDANTSTGEVEILSPGNVFTFKTSQLNMVGDSSIVDFIVTNNSNYYDAEIVISCGLETDSSLYEEYISLENDYSERTSLKSGKSKFGTLTVEYNQESQASSFEIEVTCIINEPTPLPKEESETAEQDSKDLVAIVKEGNGDISVENLEIAKDEIGQFTVKPTAGNYLSSVSCTNDYKAFAKVGTTQTSEQTITLINTGSETSSECTVIFSGVNDAEPEDDKIEVTIEEGSIEEVGSEVSIDGEHFYIIASNSDELTLLSKYTIDIANLEQDNNNATQNTIAFSSSYYWATTCTDTFVTCNIIETNSSRDDQSAAYYAALYGEKIGGKGRLMTYDELSDLVTLSDDTFPLISGDNADMIVGTNSANNFLNYWLGSAYGTGYAWAVLGSINSLARNYYDGSNGKEGVRPVIEIPRSSIIVEE